MKITIIFCAFTLFFMPMGCNAQKIQQIKGSVVTTPGLWQSFLGSATNNADDTDKPVAGAEIRLSFDNDGKQPVSGCSAISDKNGMYKIELNGIGRSPTEYGNDYYIVITKQGFEPICKLISIGPFCTYMSNTAYLKQITNNKQP